MKKLLALLMAACLLLSGTALATGDAAEGLLSATAPAVTGPHSFIRIYTYDGRFSDLTPQSTFYANVSALYEYGLSVGKKDGTYGLKDPATVGQGVIFAARIRSLYDHGDAEAGAAAFRAEGQHTYEAYLLYLQSLSALGSELDGLYFTQATRAAMAHILVNALPAEAFTAINQETVTQGYATRQYIRDVDEYTDYYQDILTLYRWGICQGVDSKGTFLPEETITRGALAAMLTRMVDPTLRITLSWDLNSAKGVTWPSLVTGTAKYVSAPATEEEFDSTIRWMLSQESLTLNLDYARPVDNTFASTVLQKCLNSAGKYSEQMLNSATCSYYVNTGKMTLTFSVAESTQAESIAYRNEALSAAIEVHDHLWDSGLLTDAMTDTEKARVYYSWICENCSYDYSADDTSLSHTAWSLFTLGTAVCDGYTGAYNLLLKLESIDCYALYSADHTWTVATLDGTEVHIDTTYGDSSGYRTDYRYFAMTPEVSYGYHPW